MMNPDNNMGNRKQITLTWENINVHVPEQKKGFFTFMSKKSTANNSRNHIVQNVNGIAKPGQLLAIMGASGAGKTTLLNVLTFRNNGKLTTTGNVKINGSFVQDPSDLTSISGYVQQDDIFIGTLKVKEHLKFQAMLRMNRAMTNEQKNERVETILNDLNLKKCEDTLIGVTRLGIKGISGGEKRRLAFASEIITDPSLLFCDEPTSGLDSFMAMSVVDIMKKLAEQGKTIICTIHQPSSEIFASFNRLLLMAEGRLAFLGDLSKAYDFFSSQGFVCPSNYNPAEFYIDKLAISPFKREESEETVKAICNSFEQSNFENEIKTEILNSRCDSINKNHISDAGEAHKYKSNSFVQIKWLFWREALALVRNPLETKINIIQTIFLAVMFGLIYFQLQLNQEGVQNINGVLFLIIVNNTFGNLFPVLNSLPSELPIFFREHKNGMYRVINYYTAKVLVEAPRFIIIPALFTAIAYWMCNLNNDISKFLICCGVIVLVAFCTTALASFISALSPSANAAIAIAAPLMAPLLVFSGFFLNNNSVPVYFIWLKYLSWINYANEVLVINQWDNINNIKCDRNGTSCIKTGDQVIASLDMNKDNFNLNLILMAIMVIVLRVLAFLTLLVKSYKK